MKRFILKTVGGLALLVLAPVNAFAHTDVQVQLGIPAPYYVEPPPVYYEPREYYGPPVVYYGPRVGYWDRDWDRHDRGRHRGHRRHRDRD